MQKKTEILSSLSSCKKQPVRQETVAAVSDCQVCQVVLQPVRQETVAAVSDCQVCQVCQVVKNTDFKKQGSSSPYAKY